RRRPEPEKFFSRFLAINDRHRDYFGAKLGDEEIRQALAGLPEAELELALTARELESLRFGYRQRVTDLDSSEIRELPQRLPPLFAEAAERARRAGFDGVELHYAHAYTMASFLSARNDRDDGYGGSLEGRLRLPLEVLEAVRERVGPDFCVGSRILSEECIPDGSTLEDAAFFAVELCRTGLDFLSLSRGGKFEDARQPRVGWAAYPYTGRSGYECMPTAVSDAFGPHGRNVEPAARIRAALSAAGVATPVVVTGGICSFAQAERILADGGGDIIGAARQSLADPDWFLKARLGRGEEIRPCIYCNYCEGLDQVHKQVTCQAWDRLELDEPGIRKTEDGKRRLIPPPWSGAPATASGRGSP
nr:NADH:flavin oxidoreductase [Thermoanaerobaculia bacterium]